MKIGPLHNRWTTGAGCNRQHAWTCAACFHVNTSDRDRSLEQIKMAERSKSKLVVVDPADVQRVADIFLSSSSGDVSDDEISNLAAKFGFVSALDTSTKWRREFVRLVKRRVEFGRTAQRKRSATPQ
jgi:hypothetical protein